MSHGFEPRTHVRSTSQNLVSTPEDPRPDSPEALHESNDTETALPAATKRSEVLRHVFPRSSQRSSGVNTQSATRAPKVEHGRNGLSSFRYPKPRVAFHRVITSFFHNSPTRSTQDPTPSETGSTASSMRPRANSLRDSIPSIEVVSPGTFLFSGPSLRSARSGSVSNTTSRLPSLTENGSGSFSLRRTRSESYSAESGQWLDDVILEPYVERGTTRPMSDILLGTSLSFEELEAPIPEDLDEDSHVSMDPVSHASHLEPLCLTAPLAKILMPYLGHAAWKALRLTCRSWHACVISAVPPKLPPAYNVPTEILQNIYQSLGPKDFNVARHTCQNWLRASLDKKLLISMLQRGGWWSSAEQNLNSRHAKTDINPIATDTSDEWFLSCRLSRECSLSSHWTGNGLSLPTDQKSFLEASLTHFDELADGRPSPDGRQSAGIVFTASICGQMLLVAKDTLIYVYRLQGTTLQAVTIIICPRRVLALSMDPSSGRNAVAALLEGRLGMVCELRNGNRYTYENSLEESLGKQKCDDNQISPPCLVSKSRGGDPNDRSSVSDDWLPGHSRPLRSSLEQPGVANFSSVDVQVGREAFSLHDTDNPQSYNLNWIDHTWNLMLRGASPLLRSHADPSQVLRMQRVPMEVDTSTFYRHLCSEDDPPRSVAICPQRRCVAFGCSAGIELHWVDALTGQSLSR